MNNKLVYIVDDDENILNLYKSELADEGFAVKGYDNGDELINDVKKELPDCVVLDIKLPGKDGTEILFELKEINKDLPVIISTAYSDFKGNKNLWSADEFIVKCSNISELVDKIKEITGVPA